MGGKKSGGGQGGMGEPEAREIGRYAEIPGDASCRVASLLRNKGEIDEHHAAQAAREGDLFHPEHWGAWRGRSEAVFGRGVAMLAEAEKRKLERTPNHLGAGWAVYFADSAHDLRRLKEAGVGAAEPICADRLFLGASVEAATACCFRGWVGGLANMREAGFAPPKVFEPIQIHNEIIQAPLLSLAWGSPSRLGGDVEALRRVVAWLASEGGEAGLEAKSESGNDALKLAILSRGSAMALALLGAGAKASGLNKAGQSAWDVFEMMWASKGARAKLDPLAGPLRSAMEREALMAAAEPGRGASGAMRM